MMTVSIAVCNGRTTPDGACQQTQPVMKKDDKWSWINPGGRCESPDRCVGCYKYFYNDGPRCTRTYLYFSFIKSNILVKEKMYIKMNEPL